MYGRPSPCTESTVSALVISQNLELGGWGMSCLGRFVPQPSLSPEIFLEPDLACVAVIGCAVGVMCVVHSVLWCRVDKWQSEGGSRCVGWCICHGLTDHSHLHAGALCSLLPPDLRNSETKSIPSHMPMQSEHITWRHG